MKQADQIRQYAFTHYVEPARRAGRSMVSIRAGDICRGLGLHGRTPNVCSALQSKAFLQLADVQLVERTGPRQSTTTRFHYAITQRSANQAPPASTSTRPESPSKEKANRRDRFPTPPSRRDLTIVIQCAGSKNPQAGHFVDGHGKPILFVARPEQAPLDPAVVYRRPDDTAPSGRTWREELIRYNDRRDGNPLGLLPAWRLYRNSVYGELVEAFGSHQVFILSAGWGLLAADFLTPNYDITFSNQAEPYKRRRLARDSYADLRMLPTEPVGPVVFLGGKDYVGLFQTLTAGSVNKRVVFYNSHVAPDTRGCICRRFETSARTNWHYKCARALIAGRVDVPG